MMREIVVAGRSVLPLGMGCWAIGGPFWAGDQPLGWGEVDDTESIAAIRRAFDLGVRLFDTADVYGTGHSEEVLARALAGHRDEVVIATKWGNVFDAGRRQLVGSEVSSGYMRSALEASLRRLGTDYIDVYQLHIGDASPADMEAVQGALDDAVAAGRIRTYGWSTDDPVRARLLAESDNFSVVQFALNVLEEAPEMRTVVELHGLTGLCRGPLGMGLLSDKYSAGSRLAPDDVRGVSPDWMRLFQDGRPTPEWLARREAIRSVLTSGGRSLPQGALAWIWARGRQLVPIPGFRTVAQVEENIKALEYGPLDAAHLVEIDRLLDRASGTDAFSVGGGTESPPAT